MEPAKQLNNQVVSKNTKKPIQKNQSLRLAHITINTGNSVYMEPMATHSGIQTAQAAQNNYLYIENSFVQIKDEMQKKKTPTSKTTGYHALKNKFNVVQNHQTQKMRAVSGSSGTTIRYAIENNQQTTGNTSNNTSTQILSQLQFKAARSVSSKKNANQEKKALKPSKNHNGPSNVKYTNIIQNPNTKSMVKNQKNLGMTQQQQSETGQYKIRNENQISRQNFSVEPIAVDKNDFIFTDNFPETTSKNQNRIIQQKGKILGKTPRNATVNNGNITTTSACNQSFHIGQNTQQKGALIDGASVNADASNGSNSRTTRNRYRSGSSKVNQKNDVATSGGSNTKSLKNPRITINTNNATDIKEPYVNREVMTTKTALGTRDIQISSTKSRDNKNFVVQLKSAITPNSGISTKIGKKAPQLQIQTSNSLTQKQIKLEGQKQKTKQQNESQIQQKSVKSKQNTSQQNTQYNLNYIQIRESSTTKNQNQVSQSQKSGPPMSQKKMISKLVKQNNNQLAMTNNSAENTTNTMSDEAMMIAAAPIKDGSSKSGHANLLTKFGQRNLLNKQQNMQVEYMNQNIYNSQQRSKTGTGVIPPQQTQQQTQQQTTQQTIDLGYLPQQSQPALQTKYYQTISAELPKKTTTQYKSQEDNQIRISVSNERQSMSNHGARTNYQSGQPNRINYLKSGQPIQTLVGPKTKKPTSQNPVSHKSNQRVQEESKNLISQDEITNASAEFCDKKSQGSQRSKFSKISKQIKPFKGQKIANLIENKLIKTQQVQIQNIGQKIKNQEEKQQVALKLETSTNNNSFIENGKSGLEDINNLKNEIKKRDDILMILCEKMQGMESQIDLLRNQQNKSNNMNTTKTNKGTDGTENHSYIYKVSPSPLDSSNNCTQNDLRSVIQAQNNDHLQKYIQDIITLPGSISKTQESIQKKKEGSFNEMQTRNQQNLNDFKTESIHQAIAIKKYTEEYQDFVHMLKQKLSEENSEASQPLDDDDDVEVKFIDDTAQEMEIKDLDDYSGFQDEHADQTKQIREKSQQRIRQVLDGMQEKLENFKKFNNPQRMAEMRKYCATNITNQTGDIGDLSSRMQHSGENSAGNGLRGSNSHKNKALKHYQSTSDAGASSLISVGYENSKYTKQSNKISSNKDQSPKINSDPSQKKQMQKPMNLSHKRRMESDPLLICMDEIERQEKHQNQNQDIEFLDNNTNSQDILDKFQLHQWLEKKLPNNSDKSQKLSDFKSQTKKQFMKTQTIKIDNKFDTQLDQQNQSEVKENHDQSEMNIDSLSKTQSKDALQLKFRKANLKNIGIQNIRKNVQVTYHNQRKDQTNLAKNPKIKLIGSSKNIWNQNLRAPGDEISVQNSQKRNLIENIQRNNFFTAQSEQIEESKSMERSNDIQIDNQAIRRLRRGEQPRTENTTSNDILPMQLQGQGQGMDMTALSQSDQSTEGGGGGRPTMFQNFLAQPGESSNFNSSNNGQLIDTTFQPFNISESQLPIQRNDDQTMGSLQLNNSTNFGKETPNKRIFMKKMKTAAPFNINMPTGNDQKRGNQNLIKQILKISIKNQTQEKSLERNDKTPQNAKKVRQRE